MEDNKMFKQTAVLEGRGLPESAFAEQAKEDWAMAGKLRATPELQALHIIPLWPLPTLCLLLGCFAIFGLSAYGMVEGWMPIPLGIINTLATYVSFTPLHDGTHRAVSRNPIVNDVISTTSGQLLFPGFEVAAIAYCTWLIIRRRENTTTTPTKAQPGRSPAFSCSECFSNSIGSNGS